MGYQVIENHKDFNFGLDPLSRLIDPNESIVKGIKEIYFVHVKNGLDSEVRTLVDQTTLAIHIISNGIMHDEGILNDFHQSILDKVKDKAEGKESKISISARKFKTNFPEKESFVKLIKEKRIVFVFAYKPLKSRRDPRAITSTAAKLEMINLVKIKNNFDFTLKFLKINKKPSRTGGLEMSTSVID